MTNLTEARIREIYEDFAHGKLDRLAEAFDPNIDFLSHAPSQFFPYLGHRHGRAAVLDAIAETHRVWQVKSFLPLTILVHDDEAALTLFINLLDRSAGKPIRFLAAHFLHFRQDRIVKFSSIIDSLDAVRQLT